MSTGQYEAVCKDQFREIKEQIGEVKAQNIETHRRLFVDNGKPSHQTRLDRNERMLKVALWIIMAVSAASIAQVTKGIWSHFQKPHTVSEVMGSVS